ncbi:hypothetical protein ATE47_16100 [Chryseobacterium sp. IHB B 17019]|uniref:hypothetical protein n=1 Tax=Chryseobacterium sp. IHB B 17019 TaxID=1721091 RepID=UPI0007201728|nr:hypothetical protein [Chryseobacterium sp. IHB B 17019]ALR31943.1 hypothetical protein ATE47_16100 [Chryseobacterium sp. IHB B 17019]
MATENTQNASQTLFRFVSLRNPQLTATKKENLGFILRPSTLPSAFDDKINPNDSALAKFQALERLAKEFNPIGYESELIIEQGPLAEALKIGRKIAKRETLSTSDEITAKSLYNSSIIQSKVPAVWDNLMYQTVTEENFYVKEALVHILKALHFGYAADLPVTEELTKINGADLKAKALEARVVLPMKFFGDGYEGTAPTDPSNPNTNNAFQVNVSQIGEGVISGTDIPVSIQHQLKAEGDKISELSKLNFEKEGLMKLKSELEKIQVVYVKAKNKAYETAYQAYQEQYKEEIDAYNAQLRQIKSQITEGMTQAQIDELYEALQPLNIPPFEFVYKDQLNFGDFKAKLSLDSLKLFVNIFTELESGEMPVDGYDFSNITALTDRKLQLGTAVIEMIDFYDTYVEVFEKLDEELSANTQLLFQKSPLQEQKYLNLGNVLVPVSNSRSNLSQIISRTYYLKASYDPTFSRTPASFTFYYQAESNSYALGSAKVTAITDFGTFDETYSNIEIVDNKVTFPPILVDKFGKLIRSLKIQIFFNNGKQATVEYTDIIIGQPYTGILYAEEITVEDPENPGEGGGTPQPGTFFPKHFGVKRLGIADYLKVVQSTHAYVAGEVTHIENVMAKEFKQKSTRKLRRSEIQTTTSKSTERETLSDTTSTTRNDMQSEVANILQQDINAEAHFRYGGGKKPFEVGGSFASHNSKETSTRQAIAKSQEITEKATERLLTKVAEERIEKIIEEFEENNAHGFDNRNGDKHVIGVYRWVDKKMKNQIYNYGKRTMFEFMIPEPAKLHRLATAATVTETLTAPIDPRIAPQPWTMADPKSATVDQLQHWASYYNVKLTELIEATKKFTTGVNWIKLDGDNGYKHIAINIPDNYQASHVKMWYGFEKDVKGIARLFTSNFAGGFNQIVETYSDSVDLIADFDPQNLTGSYDFMYQGHNIDSVNFNFEVTCKLSDAYMNAWKQENFDAIIQAYQEAYTAFKEKQKELEDAAKEQEKENQEKLSNFYRDMERVILKHNCIAFLLQDYSALGKNLTNNGTTMQDFSIILDENLDQYTALAKFMEQAFEWTIMDYTFYPYYWANRNEWQTMYLSNSTDPLFRNFLQAGMARVIVTVNPGFEDAVQFFLTTGRIWNGGEVPVIGDPMYMSIVDEMREPVGLKQGKAWISTLPTSLNILQKDSAGLVTTTALPFTQENPEEFEVPSDVVTETEFSIVDSQLNSGDDRFVDNIELNNGFLQLTTDDNPKEVVAQIPLSDLKQALQ